MLHGRVMTVFPFTIIPRTVVGIERAFSEEEITRYSASITVLTNMPLGNTVNITIIVPQKPIARSQIYHNAFDVNNVQTVFTTEQLEQYGGNATVF